MTKVDKPYLKQFIESKGQEKLNFTSKSILDGIQERLEDSNSITPKQALWIIELLDKAKQKMPLNLNNDILAAVERGSLAEQKEAERTVKNRLRDDEAKAIANRFDSLFITETKSLVKELNDVTIKLKNKVGL